MGLIVHCVSFSISLNVLCVYVNSSLGALSASNSRRIRTFWFVVVWSKHVKGQVCQW